MRQSISLTSQFTAVDEILTGRENLILIARLRHLNNPRQIADDLLKRFGLTDAADRSELSANLTKLAPPFEEIRWQIYNALQNQAHLNCWSKWAV